MSTNLLLMGVKIAVAFVIAVLLEPPQIKALLIMVQPSVTAQALSTLHRLETRNQASKLEHHIEQIHG